MKNESWSGATDTRHSLPYSISDVSEKGKEKKKMAWK